MGAPLRSLLERCAVNTKELADVIRDVMLYWSQRCAQQLNVWCKFDLAAWEVLVRLLDEEEAASLGE